MGESTNPCLMVRFDRRVQLEFQGATMTSDAGLLAARELDEALGVTEMGTGHLNTRWVQSGMEKTRLLSWLEWHPGEWCHLPRATKTFRRHMPWLPKSAPSRKRKTPD